MLRDLINFLRKKPSHEKIDIQDSWSISTALQDGEDLTIRYRINAPEQLGKHRFPTLISITWESDSLAQAVQERMNDLEDTLTEAVEKQKHAYLTAIVTGDNAREWQYYTRTQEGFMLILGEALSNLPQFPIKIASQSDPEWKAYSRLTSSQHGT